MRIGELRLREPRRWAGTLALAAFVAIGGCKTRDASDTNPPASQPAASAPSESAESVLFDPGGQTDNSFCMVCHADFTDEPIVAKHLEADIVCASCHGSSEDHGGDEANVITPDVKFGRSEIGPFCKACHPTHKTGQEYDAFVKKWSGKRRPNGRIIYENSVCTDCHGNHAVIKSE